MIIYLIISEIADSRAHLPPISGPNPYIAHAHPNAMPELYDIPIGMVNRVVYGPRGSVVTSDCKESTGNS